LVHRPTRRGISQWRQSIGVDIKKGVNVEVSHHVRISESILLDRVQTLDRLLPILETTLEIILIKEAKIGPGLLQNKGSQRVNR
jgi:hypothetical protein